MFTEATTFARRLSEVEKITVRAADTEDRISHLFSVVHRHEINLDDTAGRAMFVEAKRFLDTQFATESANTGFGNTWKF